MLSEIRQIPYDLTCMWNLSRPSQLLETETRMVMARGQRVKREDVGQRVQNSTYEMEFYLMHSRVIWLTGRIVDEMQAL